jgi:hypothetical protein
MTAKKAPGIAAEVLDRYTNLVATQPDVELKGATMPYTAVNGNMFSFIAPDSSLNLRLSKTDKAAFLTQHQAAETMQHGVVMKEYVVVPDTMWSDAATLTHYFQQSCTYAKTLKPKATRRKA